ncbi:MAG: DUF1223 domain-containing protein [Aquincola sp.]|nr:DUF1223 domain-containing protein [Aquincola sp.]
MNRLLAVGAALFPAVVVLPALAEGQCSARSSAQPPAVVELYTSEGCSSCPPADRWLSSLKGRPDVLALAFHVNYWDNLGWPDRFATAATTERQHVVQRATGAPYVYTPQVVRNGRDWRGWSDAGLQPLPRSPIVVALERHAHSVSATLTGAPTDQPLAGYWAVLEDGHASRVRAGENAGATLKHDHVVTLYKPVPVWRGTPSDALTLELPPPQGGSSRRVAFVVTDPQGVKPLQVALLGC